MLDLPKQQTKHYSWARQVRPESKFTTLYITLAFSYSLEASTLKLVPEWNLWGQVENLSHLWNQLSDWNHKMFIELYNWVFTLQNCFPWIALWSSFFCLRDIDRSLFHTKFSWQGPKREMPFKCYFRNRGKLGLCF